MRRFEELKRLDKKSRNKLRAILSNGDVNAIGSLERLRGTLGKVQSDALDAILNSSALLKAVRTSTPFPKVSPFIDTLQAYREMDLHELLSAIEASVVTHKERLFRLANSLLKIDTLYAEGDITACRDCIADTIETDGWSHALLRRIILIRENLAKDSVDHRIEDLVQQAGIKNVPVASLIHAYSLDQNILTIKRSILNLADRGAINRYTRTISKLTVQPFAASAQDLANFLSEVEKCSLIDAVILVKFNSHLFQLEDFPATAEITQILGQAKLFEPLVATYDAMDNGSEYAFFKQSSAWLEYEPIRRYRILIDNYYDASQEEAHGLPAELEQALHDWVGEPTLNDLVGSEPFTKHAFPALARLELSGTVTRSALFNYWLTDSKGEIGFEKADLLTLMGLTRDLARTVPIKAVRTAAKLAKDELVKLILYLLLAKRSKNELDSYALRKLLGDIAVKHHDYSLVKLVRSYEVSHPYVAEYIYDIVTEDFLAKLNTLAPHLTDIPEIRASLHEWMAEFTDDEHFRQRARAVRIDHQINRVRNEIDDHRIFVDPSRFSSWIEDEMMIELNSALTSTGAGKKGISVTCDEAILSLVMTQSYIAFCSNPVFGIASYLGRRIRHGTFHGHLYSSVINSIEKADKYQPLFSNPQFSAKWSAWKDIYNKAVEEIIAERLHVHSKSKPLGVLTPESYGPSKHEVLTAAVKNISKNFAETTSTAGIDQTIIDYCWRLAELDLVSVTRYLRAQQKPLKNEKFLHDELVPASTPAHARLADAFRRELELSIDQKLSAIFGWFKRPSIVAPKASVSLIFAATVAEVRDTIPDFDPQAADASKEEIELAGGFYHLVYDSLAIVVGNAAKYADRSRPLKRNFEIVPGKGKRLVVEISSSIKPTDDPAKVSADIEERKKADFQDANMYDKKSGISKLLLLASNRQDFELNQYAVVGSEVQVRLIYALEH
ncbi:hypothetical protein [Chitinolyticbacter meiyuanensis]|uniref:hypothetical protein n=1 Tax=Chitinolyticbacter meiyuanensis TaxID=682798 RepID=UPI0011E5B53F|nr:hypothetical protein [Chitinolyticbacter meiyuanensis]